MATYYIGADVHCKRTEIAIEQGQRIVERYSVPTSIAAIRQVLERLDGRKHLALEEGPLAGWLYRNLVDHVTTLTVSDPRRNRLIAQEGDKDDPIDAAKLAQLLRGKYLRSVYHSREDRRAYIKRWVSIYHDRVEAATSQINKIRACCRMQGIRVPRRALREETVRTDWLSRFSVRELAEQLSLYWLGLDVTFEQVRLANRKFQEVARSERIVRYWQAVPGMGLIRAVTLWAYLDTPRRFATKSKLWKYCGIGLQRMDSGKGSAGRAHPGRLRLAWAANKRLKNVVMGATTSALRQQDNFLVQAYERSIRQGMHPGNARRATARKLLTVLWGMWKQERRFTKRQCAVR
jgi:transposase